MGKGTFEARDLGTPARGEARAIGLEALGWAGHNRPSPMFDTPTPGREGGHPRRILRWHPLALYPPHVRRQFKPWRGGGAGLLMRRGAQVICWPGSC
jgi:hypothetical protein